ncbi:MAG: rRNA maturation RNase YbeY [Patescibacteria group bacterium]|jgi:probable rRNA maturation factor
MRIEINKQVRSPISPRLVEKIGRAFVSLVLVNWREVSLGIVGDSEIKKLNRRYRHHDQVTDVLSFAVSPDNFPAASVVTGGEIIICYPQAVRQAKAAGRPIAEEFSWLLIHGLLHLSGLDHEKSAKEAKIMARLEENLLSQIWRKKAKRGIIRQVKKSR